MQRSRKVGFVASLALVAVIAASLLVGVRSASASCGDFVVCWQLVTSTNPGAGSNALNGVVAVSAKKIWAVGYYLNSSQTNAQTLVEKGVGTSSGGGVIIYSWTTDTSTNPGTGNYLNGVGFARNDLSATDVCAVGYYTTTSVTDTLIEKNHSGSWSTVTSPNPSSSSNVLNAVSGNSASNYWAVGYSYSSTLGANVTLIEQWNGTSWSQISGTPNPGTGTRNDYLTSVTAVDSTHAWAAGYYTDGSGAHPLALKYLSGSWQDDTSHLPSNSGHLYATSFIGGTDGWAVGDAGLDFQHTSTGWGSGTLAGDVWQGLDYIGSSSAWVVGYHPATFDRSRAEYWDGTTWTDYTLAGSGASFGDHLNAVNGVSNTDTWAVGIGINCCSYALTTLIEHYN